MRTAVFFSGWILFFPLAGCKPAAPPAFTGVWHGKSPENVLLAIDHHEPEIKVRSGTMAYTYTTDSSETCNVVDGEMVCSRGHWDGPFLQIDSTIKREKGDVTLSERWSLSRDGSSLTIQRQGPGSNSRMEFSRQGAKAQR